MEGQSLDIIRNEIDNIDKTIVELMEKRFKLVTEVGEYKLSHDMPVFDEEREQKVIDKYKGYLKDRSYDEYIEEICIDIMEVSKKIQKKEVFKEKSLG
ncbi:chorismate mutase [Hathewaya proteolytica DSM 3090]|uniref:Chorismate mutase n=1 Tax=Hathewaya proteolytica DSM 3090 TaxID=1121331 RepID=A0A1M6QC25_9CLOT|nr:chorismate mutase [Hathewaya proteolytica]SHK17716.1 chorismate mutase [Hathewaya proteolytica DSM 3090]